MSVEDFDLLILLLLILFTLLFVDFYVARLQKKSLLNCVCV